MESYCHCWGLQMSSDPLENLVNVGSLKAEPHSRPETDGLVRSAAARLKDARNKSLAIESRFDLAYNASHALALAALRRKGYRSENRYVVFQALQHTLALPAAQWRVLAKAHGIRNQGEYEGLLDVGETLVEEVIEIAQAILDALDQDRAALS